MRRDRLYLAAFISAIITTATGTSTAGLGQGLDLGTTWPGTPQLLLEKILEGSLEPVHRISTVVTGALYLAALVSALKSGNRAERIVVSLAFVLLIATAITGRFVLLALARELPEPWLYLIYPLNNALALGTGAAMAVAATLALRIESRSPRYHVLLRGAAAWGAIASVLGAYFTGLHKVTRTWMWSPLLAMPWGAHVLAGALAVALGLAAFAMLRPVRCVWGLSMAASGVALPILGLVTYMYASVDPWAPGIWLGLHGALAHLFTDSAIVLYLAYRRVMS